MVRLFMSDRILVDGHNCAGGIVVNDDGKFGEIFKTQAETVEWLIRNHHVEVNTFPQNLRGRKRNS